MRTTPSNLVWAILFGIVLSTLTPSLMRADEVKADEVKLLSNSIVDKETLTFAAGPAAKFSTAVNGRSHQQTPLTTYRGYQYVTYFDAQRRVCIGRRKLPAGSWEVIYFNDHRFKTNDSHNTTVLGICVQDGTIHMAFDHHASKLNYRVSKLGAAHDPESVQWNADLFGTVTHSLGSVAADPKVTYPRFFSAPNGNLMLFYRSVTSGNGNGMLEEYDGKEHDWTPSLGKAIARDMGTFEAKGKTSEFRCPYMNSVSYAGERLHMSWVWRDRFEKTNPRNQHDLGYAYSDDDGLTWMNSAGNVIGRTGKDFIHLNSPGVVVAEIPIDSGLSNQTTHFAYADGSIHVVVRQTHEALEVDRYFHYWRDSKGEWRQEILPFSGGRPKLVGTRNRSLVLVYTDEYDDGKEELLIAQGQPNSDLTGWQWSSVKLPFRQSLSGEPLVDYARWKREEVLSIYFQEEPEKTIRTNKSGPVDGLPAPLRVLDLSLTGLLDE